MKKSFKVISVTDAVNGDGEIFGKRIELATEVKFTDELGLPVNRKYTFWYTVAPEAQIEEGKTFELEASQDQDGNWEVAGFVVKPVLVEREGKEITIRRLIAVQK